MTITNVKTGVLGVDDVYKKTLSEYYTYSGGICPLTGGNLFMVGYGGYFGNGNCLTADVSSPVQIPGTWICSNDGGNYTTVLQKSDNTIWGIGGNPNRIWCDGPNKASSPVQVPGSTWCLVVTGNNSTVHAIKTDNTLWACGFNEYGQLGINNNTDQNVLNEKLDMCSHKLLSNQFYTVAQSINTVWNGHADFTIPDNLLMHHANWTIGVSNKIKLLELVKEKYLILNS